MSNAISDSTKEIQTLASKSDVLKSAELEKASAAPADSKQPNQSNMKIQIVTKRSLAIAEGVHQGVIVDQQEAVVKGRKSTPKSKLRVTWEIPYGGGRVAYATKDYDPVCKAGSEFWQDLQRIRGHDITSEEEANGSFEPSSLVGLACDLLVIPARGEEKGTAAKILRILHPSKTPLKPSGKYVRKVEPIPDAPVVTSVLDQAA